MKLVVYFLTRGSFCPTQMGYFDHQVSLFTASYMIFCIVKQVCCALLTYAAPCNSIFIFCLHCLIWIILFCLTSYILWILDSGLKSYLVCDHTAFSIFKTKELIIYSVHWTGNFVYLILLFFLLLLKFFHIIFFNLTVGIQRAEAMIMLNSMVALAKGYTNNIY